MRATMDKEDIMQGGIDKEFAKIYLENNLKLSRDDALVLLSNTIRYKEGLPEPVKGMTENIRRFSELVKKEVGRLVDVFCEEYRGSGEGSNIKETIRKVCKMTNEVEIFCTLARVLYAIIQCKESLAVGSIFSGIDRASLAALTLLITRMEPTFDELCNGRPARKI